MKKPRFMAVLVYVISAFILAACGSKTETPVVSEFPRITVREPAKTSAPYTSFTPNQSAPIQLSLSYTAGVAVEETRIYKIAMEFMRRRPDVYITLNYTKILPYESDDEYVRETTEDINYGVLSDIFIFNSRFVMNELSKSGKLADIGELIDTDTEAARSDFFEKILDAMSYEGKLYIMPIAFTLDVYSMKKEYVRFLEKPLEEYDTISIRDMMVAYEKLIKETESPGTLYMFAEQDYYYSAYHALDLEGIDYNKKTVEIYNEDAYQLLNRTLNIPRVSELGYARSAYNDFFFEPSVDFMFADRNSITTYLMYDDLKYTAPIPFSNASGEAIFYPQESAVISNSCTEKDTAWEFLKFFLGYDDARADTDFSVSNLYRSYPVQREMFRKYTEKIFSNLYDRNIVEHTIPYSKDEAIERAVAACEKNMDQASRRVIMNEKPYRDIWMPYISECIGNSSSSIPELMKGLESDIREMLTGRK